jgi:hypothetical protein
MLIKRRRKDNESIMSIRIVSNLICILNPVTVESYQGNKLKPKSGRRRPREWRWRCVRTAETCETIAGLFDPSLTSLFLTFSSRFPHFLFSLFAHDFSTSPAPHTGAPDAC